MGFGGREGLGKGSKHLYGLPRVRTQLGDSLFVVDVIQASERKEGGLNG